MIRQHQFDKVELVAITTPEQSDAEHERMTGCAEAVLKRLGLPYRVMLLCTGDMGFARAQDLRPRGLAAGPGHLPRDLELLELRRLPGAAHEGPLPRRRTARGPRFVHTLNGSGLAVGRTLIAVLENYQQADGSVAIPEALRPYMGGLRAHRRRWLSALELDRRRAASWSPTTTASTPRHQGAGADRARSSATMSGWWRPRPSRAAPRHSLTLRRPLRVRKLAERRFAVDGTPTDCVLLALSSIIKDDAGRPGAVRRQSRRQSRRGRDLFRHGRGRDGGDAARRAGDRAQPGLRDGASDHVGDRPSVRRRGDPPAAGGWRGPRTC